MQQHVSILLTGLHYHSTFTASFFLCFVLANGIHCFLHCNLLLGLMTIYNGHWSQCPLPQRTSRRKSNCHHFFMIMVLHREQKQHSHHFRCFSFSLLENIVKQTKLFASQKGVTLNLCVEDLMAFIGLNVAMGMLHLPQIKDYWSISHILSTPWFLQS